jgi:polyribonucleotide nucleotidyltransferase
MEFLLQYLLAHCYQAKEARLAILDVMNEAIDDSR